jgi:uncharacterized SAM-binding protein YcdF (DUF218 family)
VYSAELLRRAGIDAVVLVVHSFDVPRARAEFAASGIKTLAAPAGIPSNESDTALEFVPSMAGLRTSYYAIYEITANLVRWTTRALGQQCQTERRELPAMLGCSQAD